MYVSSKLRFVSYLSQVTKGKIWPLITLLSAITAVMSTFLDNVTTVLLMTPVTIRYVLFKLLLVTALNFVYDFPYKLQASFSLA